MHFVVLLGLGYISLFLIPASIHSLRWFLAVWGLCVAMVGALFARHFASADTADALAHMFDRALLDICALTCLLALSAWSLRHLAKRLGWTSYRHWVVLFLGCVAIPTALFVRFTQ